MGILMLNGNNYTGGVQQVYGSSSGAIASFDDGGDNKPLKSLKVAINPVQSGSGDPSPSNVRPITGWTGANVTRCGKNLLVKPITIYSDNQTFENSFFIKKGTYLLSYTIGITNRIGIRLYDLSGNLITDIEHKPTNTFTYNNNVKAYYQGADSSGGDKTIQVSIVDDCYILVISNVDSLNYTNAQLKLDSTATTYDPYNGTTYPITWSEAGEVFGGYIEFKDGEWKGYKTHKEVDLGTLTYTYHPASAQYTDYYDTNSMPSDCQTGNRDVVSDMYCSIYSAITSTNIAHTGYDDNVMAIAQNTRRLIICDQRFTSASDLQTALSGVNLIYPLTTPIPFTLDSPLPNIKTLLGNNNIWSDTGDILECVYQRDLNIVINQFDARITALEQAMASLSRTRSLSLSKSAPIEEPNEEITEEPKEEEQNEDKR